MQNTIQTFGESITKQSRPLDENERYEKDISIIVPPLKPINVFHWLIERAGVR